MIMKQRTIPRTLLKYQALERRLPSHHPKLPLIQENIRKRIAGYKGECALDYPLSFLPKKKYLILHDVRLQIHEHFFQIDSILLSEMFILLLEVKHMAGKLYFDHSFKQLIQTIDGGEKAYPDPVLQKKQHEVLFTQWLSKNKLPSAPLLSLIVISNSFAIIQTSSENQNLRQAVIHHEYLPYKIQEFEEKWTRPCLTTKDCKKIAHKLIRLDTPLDIDILECLEISPSELIKGVFCPNCGKWPMKRIHGTWFCSSCHHKDKQAHVSAFHDYELLIGPTITNRETQDFLCCSSGSLCRRLLQDLQLKSFGQNRGRIYLLS